MPPAFRGAEPTNAGTASLADLKWFELFKDEQLGELVRKAHARNFDLREAVARVEAAEASFGITRADLYPTAGMQVDATTLRTSRGGSFPLPQGFQQNRTFGGVALNLLSFEADVWGRLRSANDAARSEVLAADENVSRCERASS
jgi:multidrug efflux system outer membrane protein